MIVRLTLTFLTIFFCALYVAIGFAFIAAIFLVFSPNKAISFWPEYWDGVKQCPELIGDVFAYGFGVWL